MEHVAMHPLWVAVADALLYTRSTMWMGQEKVELESHSQISANTALCVGPGAIDQPLHRDDAQYFNDVPATTVDKYEIGRERMLMKELEDEAAQIRGYLEAREMARGYLP
ncbi:hypothetical protein IFM62136_03201 [Aspergillus lentulus]|nr:hypothetical protein IFM62136_03201 [Aspergillus lentulus]